MSIPLTEKYRPKSMDEVTGNIEIVECIKSLDIKNLPNMLFYGPPGTGKTTTIRALLKDFPKENILELNASDERGINTVREKIKEFASTRGISERNRMVILDEADSMSKDAQSALRRIIEDFKNCRFCIICNYVKKIIDPIVSRCSKFRFFPVNEPNRIKEVCLKEGILYDEEGIEIINEYSDGDMRKVMNDIQGIRGTHTKINRENVLEFYGVKDGSVYKEVFEYLLSQSFDSCKAKIAASCLDATGLIDNLSNLLVKSNVKRKIEICKSLADIEGRISQGCSDTVQINAIIAAFLIAR